MRKAHSIRLRCLAPAIAALLLAPAAEAQVTGSVVGAVKDESGALLSGATVTVRGGTLTAEGLTTASDSQGNYRFPLVPPGTYELSAAQQGFAAQVRKNVEVALGRETRVDFTLGVAGREEALIVTGEGEVVDVSRSAVANRVSQQTIDALPLNSRDFVDLVALVPGATPVSGGPQGGSLDQVSIFGERAAALSFLVDGVDNNDPLNGGPFVRYTQDSVREFEVITTGYGAQFGRAQGGVTNIVTRSGSNDWRASAFTFLRKDGLDSVPEELKGQDPPQLDRTVWGASLGGPIARDRLFSYGTFEVFDETRGVSIDRSKIPAFVANGLATPGGNEDFGIAPRTDRLNGMLKLDWNLSTNHRLFVQANRSDEDVAGEISSPVLGTIALPSAERSVQRTANAGILRHTGVLRPNVFLETSASLIKGRLGSNLEREGRFEPILLLLSSGFMQTGAPFGGKNDRTTRRFQLAQNLTWDKHGWGGDHELRFGWDLNRTGVKGFDDVVNDVEYSAAFLSPDAVAINEDLFRRFGFQQSAARFFLSLPGSSDELRLDMKDTSWSLFAQDDWKLRAVTLNLGLRYDRSSLFGGDTDNFGPRLGATWDVGERHKTVLRANWGRFHDRNLLSAAATVPEKGGFFARTAFDVALPRLGADYTDSLIDLVITSGFPTGGGGRTPAENAAYLPFANDLRNDPLALYRLLGISVGDPRLPPVVTAANIQQLSGLSPSQAVALLERTYPGTDWEFFDVPGGSLLGDRVLSFFPRGPLSTTRELSRYAEDRTPVTNAFNLGIEQELFGGVSFAVTYVHRRSQDLLTRRIVNLVRAAPGQPGFGQTTDGGPRINQVTYEGRIEYDGVAVALFKRFSHNYSFLISYTHSTNDDNLLTGAVGSTFSDNNDPDKDFGPSNQSVPDVFVASGLVRIPWDVTLSGIFNWRSGIAFNPRGIRDLDGDGLVDQRDTTVPRNDFRTAAYMNADARLEKAFRVGGKHALSVLAEGFNLLNRGNVKNITNVSGAQFGTPTEYFPGREIQFGFRYLFGS